MSTNYCASCGMKVMPTMKVCPSCGHRTFSAPPPVPGAPPSPVPVTAAPSSVAPAISGTPPPTPPKTSGFGPGVRGWLAFFCVSLTILTPLVGVGSLWLEWTSVKDYFDQLPRLQSAVIVDIVASFVILLFSFYAGLQMWQVKPGAVAVAKRFLIANLVYGLVVPAVVAAMIGLPDLAGDAVKTALRAVIYTAIWYPYLLKSKRVRATYS